ncbi:MAG: hypothetical protein SWH78_06415 [Thermodesulfobacteriota bacterium]|nr:hypothetical protein [Thermodesulfobacteriota bacterium]
MTLINKSNNSLKNFKFRPVNILMRWCFLSLSVFFLGIILLSSQVQASKSSSAFSLEFSDNGRLSLNSEGTPLGTLVQKLHEKTKLAFIIQENLLEHPISVRFQSLPLNEAVKRILRGVNYACIFDINGNLEKIITVSATSKANGSSFQQIYQERDLQHHIGTDITAPFEVLEAMEQAAEFEPPPEVIESMEETAVFGPLPKVMEAMEEAIRNASPLDIGEVMKHLPPAQFEYIANAMKAEGIPLPPEMAETEQAGGSWHSLEEEELEETVEIVAPPEEDNPYGRVNSRRQGRGMS